MLEMLNRLTDEYKSRDALLYSPSLIKATDAKSVRRIYPEKYHLFQPIFLVVDEYARFAESREVQAAVTELVETAGFVNVHVILASQRPDASTVLRPRIRANLLCRMAFTTADRKNSEVILDREGAEKLGKIPGRGILNDGDAEVVQVPFIDSPDCNDLLRPYDKELINYEQAAEGYNDIDITDQIQSLIKESISVDDMFGEYKPNQRSQSSFEKDVFGWEDTPDTKGKG
jgi:DNA segregation ATPase FtsK/SpoIIIE-like protein